MMRLARIWTLATACLLVTAMAPAAAGGIGDFVGSYAGTGVAKSQAADILNLKKRDLNVTIARNGKGFSVAWTTVVRRGGIEEVSRSTTKLDFVPTASPRMFKAPGRSDPTGPLGYSWANIKDRTLTVYLLVVDPEDGGYDLHSYARTIMSKTKMHLKFTRIRKGRPRVIVEGDMTRK